MREVAVNKATSEKGSSVPIVGDEDRAGFGEFLTSARRRAGRSLEEIERSTKLSRRNLEALEQGRVEMLPPGMYRRAILRSYAASVALDPQVAIERFDRIFGGAAAQPDGGGRPEPVPQRTLSPRSRVAPLRPVLMSAMASVPAIALPSIRAASLRLPHPVQPRHLVVAVTLVLAAIGSLYFLRLPSSDPRRTQLTAPQVPLKPPTRAVAARASDASDTAPSTGTSGRDVPATVSQTATGPAPVTRQDQGLIVTSTPAGARVTVNGIGWGITPVTIRYLPPGDKIVRVTKDGYAASERRVQIDSDAGTAAVRLTLQRREPDPE